MRGPSDTIKYLERTNHYFGPMGPWFEHLVEDEGLSLGDARAALAGWEPLPFVDAKHGHMATLIKRNKEIHFAIFRRFRHKGHVTRARVVEFFEPLLDKEVFLVTKVGANEDSRFIERLGFEELGVTMSGMRTFILNTIRYPGVKS